MPNVRILFPAFALSLAFVACEDSTSSNNSDGESSSSNSSSSGASPIAGLLCSKNKTFDAGYKKQSFSFSANGTGVNEYHYKDAIEMTDKSYDFDWSIQGDSIYASIEDESMTLSYSISAEGVVTLLVPSNACTSDGDGTSSCTPVWVNYPCVKQ